MAIKSHWTAQQERSNPFWILLLLRWGQILGRPAARALLPFIVAYFVLFPGGSQVHSRRYLDKILPRPAGWLDIARHFHCFASTVLDRLFLFSGQTEDFAVDNPDAGLFDDIAAQGCGALLMIAHVGSFDALRLAVGERNDGLRLRVLMDLSQAASMNAVLKSLNPDLLDSIIDTSRCRGPDLMLKIRDELAAGAVIGIMADRLHTPDERSVSVDFLGQPMALPANPWLIASVMKVPVFLGLGLYQGKNRYRLLFERLATPATVPRHQRDQVIRQQAQQFADRLGVVLQDYPLNWFNFYDVWAPAPAPARNVATTS